MIISTDLGLTGYISFCSIEDGLFVVKKTTRIITQSKNHKLDVLKETTSIVKNQIDFTANYEIIIDNIKDDDDNIGLFEQITTRPFNSKVSSMSLADTSAVFRCLFESLSMDYKIIPPANWKRFLNVTSDKKTSIELFNSLVKRGDIKINFKKNIKNHNEIESILIAYYYYSINKKSLI